MDEHLQHLYEEFYESAKGLLTVMRDNGELDMYDTQIEFKFINEIECLRLDSTPILPDDPWADFHATLRGDIGAVTPRPLTTTGRTLHEEIRRAGDLLRNAPQYVPQPFTARGILTDESMRRGMEALRDMQQPQTRAVEGSNVLREWRMHEDGRVEEVTRGDNVRDNDNTEE